MSDQHTPPAPITDGSESEFLRRVLAHIDAWFDDDANLDDLDSARNLLRQRLATTITAAGTGESEGGDPVVALIATELHRLRHARMAATVITRGGHVHDHVRIQAVHCHHTVLSRAGQRAGVLLPMRFIESVTPLGGGTPDAATAAFSHRKEC